MFKYESQLETQLKGITGERSAVDALIEVVTDADFKSEDVGTYLLILEEKMKERAIHKDSIKVIKSNTKMILEYSLQERKGQEHWPEGSAKEQVQNLAKAAGSVNNLAKACRNDIKEMNEPTEEEGEKAVDINATIQKMIDRLIKEGCKPSEIKAAMNAIAKTIK